MEKQRNQLIRLYESKTDECITKFREIENISLNFRLTVQEYQKGLNLIKSYLPFVDEIIKLNISEYEKYQGFDIVKASFDEMISFATLSRKKAIADRRIIKSTIKIRQENGK